ncbi:MAG: hypothetical protein HC904_14340 [Blastochloris sp.]|nr:hypothetical protein [Blastochloris sp.]
MALLLFVLFSASTHAMGLLPRSEEKPTTTQETSTPAPKTNTPVPASNSAESREVYQRAAQLIARFLQEQHFAKHPLDENVSREWIDSYMKGLDYNHLFFLKSDLDDFEKKIQRPTQRQSRCGRSQPRL